MKIKEAENRRVADESPLKTAFAVLTNPALHRAGFRCTKSIFYNFFFRQYRAALHPGRIPVASVDHPLDPKIPFNPRWVGTYLDFIPFWMRSLGFLIRHYGGNAPLKAYIEALDRVYVAAAEVYAKHLSTTQRPRYLRALGFIIIHTFDPHLMCIPSLHVMVVILTYTRFRAVIRDMGGVERFAPRIDELKQGAVKITQAILYVKQHSINCVAAGMYAMTRFDPSLFPPEEARDFVSQLFLNEAIPDEKDRNTIAEYILDLYAHFLEEGTQAVSWEEPLLRFLDQYRGV